ncbi:MULTISPECIES: helix-turn-helix domain-containing protein [unclassified Shewanella]|uniref:AlbA family DNA-binding domain-containing protein n=1 Tax=unclassified Shewanella TaxID=196818 RepID=UPI0021D97D5E|nr:MULTISPECIES: ATP-binding protein [unclassified Shewanella]MCU8024586.1 ATP-binding protein [Shewanella sp. SM78]MCU8081541.1 ATP-binding protein [Shewanella sp. SM103]
MQRIEIQTLSDIELLVESQQVEFKLAAGKDGFGTLPKDFWPSYSAMANCKGGWIMFWSNPIGHLILRQYGQ